MRDPDLFSNGGIYHVYNRGVDKRTIFADAGDYGRFIDGMVAFNEVGRRAEQSISRASRPKASERPYVHVICYCLMPNHFHLMLEQAESNGISEFMMRLGNGYTKYFNKRHDRVGRLLESAYKIRRVETTDQQSHLTRYIHLNPLDLAGMSRKRKRVEWSRAEAFLNRYPWSSFRHYAGIEMQDFVRMQTGLKHVGTQADYKRFLAEWVENPWLPGDPTPGVG